jgi:hypothetical protein
MAKSFAAVLHYYSNGSLLPSKIKIWNDLCFKWMCSWPALFVLALDNAYLKDEALDKTGRGARRPATTVPPRDLDIANILQAVKSYCEMVAVLPRLLPLPISSTLGNGALLFGRAQNLISATVQRTLHLVSFSNSKFEELETFLPQALPVAVTGMKAIMEYNQHRALLRGNEVEINLAIGRVINTLETMTVLGNKKFVCPPACEKEFTALALVVIRAFQSFSDQNFNPRVKSLLSKSIPRMRVAKMLPGVVLPSDVPKGIDLWLELAAFDYQLDLTGPENDVPGPCKAQIWVRDKTTHVKSLKDLRKKALEASASDTERLVKRAEVLAALPCAFVGCRTFPAPGKDSIKQKCCGGCKLVAYCSAESQRKDWASHKVACKAVAAAGGRRGN